MGMLGWGGGGQQRAQEPEGVALGDAVAESVAVGVPGKKPDAVEAEQHEQQGLTSGHSFRGVWRLHSTSSSFDVLCRIAILHVQCSETG